MGDVEHIAAIRMWAKEASELQEQQLLAAADAYEALRAERDAALAEVESLRGHLQAVVDACDRGRFVSGGAGGMTIEANIRGSTYAGVAAWPVEEARTYLQDSAALTASPGQEG
jgi:hypothetical protein